MNAEPVVVLDDRRVVQVTGDDRSSFLEATLSQRIEGRAEGEVVGALWLDVHGATQVAMDVVVLEQRLLLLVPESHLAGVLEGLAMRTFLAQASFSEADDVVVAVRGADAAVASDGDVVAVPRAGGVDLVGARDAVERRIVDAGLPAPSDDLTPLLDWEVRNGVPRVPHEVAGPHLPEELGLLPTHVHLAKGCYPGQEAVARMWMLGRPRRRLVVLAVDAGRPGVGDEAGAGRARWVVTRVTSDGGHALAFAPSDVGAGDRVEAEGWAGTVERVVGEGLPQPGADPNVTRRRDRARLTG